MLAGVTLVGTSPASVENVARPEAVIQIADQQVRPPAKRRRLVSRHGRYYVVEEYPIACEAVRFPQSPLCVGRPFQRSWYAGIEW